MASPMALGSEGRHPGIRTSGITHFTLRPEEALSLVNVSRPEPCRQGHIYALQEATEARCEIHHLVPTETWRLVQCGAAGTWWRARGPREQKRMQPRLLISGPDCTPWGNNTLTYKVRSWKFSCVLERKIRSTSGRPFMATQGRTFPKKTSRAE